MATNQWTTVCEGIRRNNSSRTLYANFRFKGKTFRHSFETEDKTVAKNKLVDFRRDLEKGPVRNEENTIIRDASPLFLDSLAGMSASSITRAKGHMKFFVEDFAGRNPRDLKPMDLETWLRETQAEEEFSNDCWNKYASTLEKLWEFLIKNSFATDNPAKLIPFRKPAPVRKITPSTDQVNAILEHIRNKPYFPEKGETADFLEFLALTGQGKAEAVHAIWVDVSFPNSKVSFYRQKTRANAHAMPLFPALREFLERRLAGKTPTPDEPIFKIKSAKKALGSACEALGFPHMGHHALRRYFITQRLMEGIPPNIIAKWVGHKNTDMVMEIYASIPANYEVSFAEKISLKAS